MRVYEFSKEVKVPSKDLLQMLSDNGFEVKSHMSVLSEKELEFLHSKFNLKNAKIETKATSEESVKKVTTVQKINSIPVLKETSSMQTATNKSIVPENKPQVSIVKEIKPDITGVGATLEKHILQKNDVEVAAPQAEIVLEPMLISEVALKIHKPVNEVILTLLKWGIIANKNQLLNVDIIARIAEHYQAKIIKPVASKAEAVTKGQITVSEGDFKPRLPVVVVLGHVDHGKTTLLDFIRKTRVAAKEKGGITQHIGAYEAQTLQGNIVFLDTPGHEAFSKMRIRGIKAADVAILVVAADDGIMPQTVEAIKLIKAMNVPVIVAINKVDKVDAVRLETIKRQLAQHDLLPEEWGGQVVCVAISAKEGKNIDQLLDMIVLQAQLLELLADVSGLAKGYVIEAKLEKGRGPVATVLCQHGNLKIGDYFIAGTAIGRVSSLVNSQGVRLKEVGPSIPVQVAGFEQLPEAGDYFEVLQKDQQRKTQLDNLENKIVKTKKTYSAQDTIDIIIKTDANSSKEALIESIEKLSKKSPKSFNIVFAGVGQVSESDIDLAVNTHAKIIALHVKASNNALMHAQNEGIKINQFDIIYKLLESLEVMAEKAKEIKMVRKKIGEASVLKVFDIKNLGVIAGAQVKDGRFSRDGFVIIFRGNRKIGEGKITSLQRDKKTVKEVHTGFECAFLVEGITEWQQDDRVECYIDVPEA